VEQRTRPRCSKFKLSISRSRLGNTTDDSKHAPAMRPLVSSKFPESFTVPETTRPCPGPERFDAALNDLSCVEHIDSNGESHLPQWCAILPQDFTSQLAARAQDWSQS
jgi:hypothetical protein